MFVAGLFSGIIFTVFVIILSFRRYLFLVSKSQFDFGKTIELLTDSVYNKDWNLSHLNDLQEEMETKGNEVMPVRIFSICKPDLATRILNSNKDRHLSAIMTCRIAVYQKSNGETYISRLNSGLIARLLGGNASLVMGMAAEGSEKIIKPLIR